MSSLCLHFLPTVCGGVYSSHSGCEEQPSVDWRRVSLRAHTDREGQTPCRAVWRSVSSAISPFIFPHISFPDLGFRLIIKSAYESAKHGAKIKRWKLVQPHGTPPPERRGESWKSSGSGSIAAAPTLILKRDVGGFFPHC